MNLKDILTARVEGQINDHKAIELLTAIGETVTEARKLLSIQNHLLLRLVAGH